jgi:hypothetical protein
VIPELIFGAIWLATAKLSVTVSSDRSNLKVGEEPVCLDPQETEEPPQNQELDEYNCGE